MLQLKRFVKGSTCLMFFILVCMTMAHAQQPALNLIPSSEQILLKANSILIETDPPIMPMMPSEVLKKFAFTEGRFRETMRQYAFRRDVTLQTIGTDGSITGEYIRNSQFVLDDRGGRVERVLYHPQSTIHEMKITKEDIQDLACAQLFGFEITDMSRYQLTYVGQETIDGRQTYAIDVTPRQVPDPQRMRQRFFVGRIWIDALSFQIAKIRGIAVPQGKQRFPIFETWREQFAGSDILFPASTFADEILHFPGRAVHYRIRVKYYDYKRFASKVSIIELDQP
jgi:hypothetical protein